MPLTMARSGEPNEIKRIGGREDTKRFLENLGFVTGGLVTVINQINGNLIVNVKDTRVAISKEMANKIMIYPANGILKLKGESYAYFEGSKGRADCESY